MKQKTKKNIGENGTRWKIEGLNLHTDEFDPYYIVVLSQL